jgi:hypothetical protein
LVRLFLVDVGTPVLVGGEARQGDRAGQDSDGEHGADIHRLAPREHHDQIRARNNKWGDHAVRDVQHSEALQTLLGQRQINEVRYRGGELHRRMAKFEQLLASHGLANVRVVLAHEADKLIVKQLLLIQRTPWECVALNHQVYPPCGPGL